MREKLQKYLNDRGTFSGTVKDFGMKRKTLEETILLLQIRDHKGNTVTDHTWITLTQDLKRICPCFGDRISFEALVTTYISKYGENLGFTEVKNVRVTHLCRRIAAIV